MADIRKYSCPHIIKAIKTKTLWIDLEFMEMKDVKALVKKGVKKCKDVNNGIVNLEEYIKNPDT